MNVKIAQARKVEIFLIVSFILLGKFPLLIEIWNLILSKFVYILGYKDIRI